MKKQDGKDVTCGANSFKPLFNVVNVYVSWVVIASPGRIPAYEKLRHVL